MVLLGVIPFLIPCLQEKLLLPDTLLVQHGTHARRMRNLGISVCSKSGSTGAHVPIPSFFGEDGIPFDSQGKFAICPPGFSLSNLPQF